MNIFGVNRESAVENLFKEPHIKNANIEFEGLYKIKIIVSERIPKYYVKAGLAFYEIAEDGIIISTEGMGKKIYLSLPASIRQVWLPAIRCLQTTIILLHKNGSHNLAKKY
jgi:cell division septal protein FtsQ